MTAPADRRLTWGKGWAAAEWAVALALTAAVCVLHARHFLRAGPLWRDEVSTVEIADSPTVRAWYLNKVNDWTPMLFDGVVRAWTWAGPGRSDLGLRALPLAVGVGIAGALWVNARRFGAPVPAVSLALLGLNGLAICYGGSLRAYGPGILAGLLVTGAVFHLTQVTDPRRVRRAFALALVAALAATHTSYFDAPWLLAACAGGAAVCALHGRWWRAAATLGIGMLCAASLLVYLPVARARMGMRQLLSPTTVPWAFGALNRALARSPTGEHPDHALIWQVWVAGAVGVGCIGCFGRAFGRRGGRAGAAPQRDAVAFCLLTLTVGVGAYVGFLRVLHDYLAPYHFLVLFALAATCVDGLLIGAARPIRPLLVLAAACGATLALADDGWRSAGIRMTNVDRVADRLRSLARPGDLIVVDPWWMGPSVARYYRGAGDLVTVPPMPPTRFQRFDLETPMFDDPHAIEPALARVSAAARADHRIWIVIHPLFPLSANPRVPLPVPESTWVDGDYYRLWTRRVALALQADGLHHVRPVDVGGDGDDVNPYEDLELVEPTR
jgi:hypothetical protein